MLSFAHWWRKTLTKAKNEELDVKNEEVRVEADAKQEEVQQVSTAAKRKREVEEEKIQEVSTEKKRSRNGVVCVDLDARAVLPIDCDENQDELYLSLYK